MRWFQQVLTLFLLMLGGAFSSPADDYEASYQSPLTTTAPATIAEHTATIETGSCGETRLRRMAIGHAQPLFGLTRILKAPNTTTVYRGVRSNHPGFQNATQGIAKPRRPLTGHSNPTRHNLGDTRSKLVSTSTDPNIAAKFAGPDGVIIKAEVPVSRTLTAPNPISPSESEILIRGTLRGSAFSP